MKRLVVLSGAGISAESGIATFRDSNGLWEGHDVMAVASPEGWHKNMSLVLDFYNKRRQACLSAQPNLAHIQLANLEKEYDVTVITQNVDDLHERAGSSKVIHLHGELFKSQSTQDPRLVYQMDHWELNIGDNCEKGSQLRPFIVWFGEQVPMMDAAMEATENADIFAVIGTSLLVYPAAGLVNYAGRDIPKFLIDIQVPVVPRVKNLIKIQAQASSGIGEMIRQLQSSKI